MSERLLLLSYCFPPWSLPEAMLSAKRFAAIGDTYEIDVVCAGWMPAWVGLDRSLDEYVASHFRRVVRVHPSATARMLRSDRLTSALLAPDAQRILNGPARRAGSSLLRSNQYAAVVSWSQMHSVHLVGRALSARFSLPWIAHLSDPWLPNPYVTLGTIARFRNARLERDVFEHADRLLFPAEETLDLSVAGYPQAIRAKSRVLPHAFEPSLYPPGESDSGGDRIVIRYLGSFYGPRSPAPLVAALRLIVRDRPDLAQRLTIDVIGSVDARMLASAGADDLPPGLFVANSSVDYVTSLALMRSADALLVVDAPADASPFLPSKLVDYVGARRPIGALTPPGPAAALTRRLGGPVADPRDPEACAAAICELAALATSDASFGPEDVRAEYSTAAVGIRFAAEIREVIASRG